MSRVQVSLKNKKYNLLFCTLRIQLDVRRPIKSYLAKKRFRSNKFAQKNIVFVPILQSTKTKKLQKRLFDNNAKPGKNNKHFACNTNKITLYYQLTKICTIFK